MNPSRVPELRVRGLWHRVLSWLALAALAGVVGAGSTLLIASWLVRDMPSWQRPSALPLLLWLLTGAIAAAWFWLVGQRMRRWSRRAAAAEIEQRVGLPEGSVQGAVEPGPTVAGTSRSLLELHRLWVARHLQGKSVRRLGSTGTRLARSYALVAALYGGVMLATACALWIGARSSTSEAWAAVLHPVRHLTAPPLPGLRLSAADTRVRRGEDLPVTVQAPGRDSVRLNWQPLGLVTGGRWLELHRGTTRAVVPRVESATLVWASAVDGAVSDTLEVMPVDPLLLVDAQLTLSYPPHTRRDTEVLSPPWPLVEAPEGTRATLTGSLSLPVQRVALRDSLDPGITLQITDARRFRGSFVVRSGSWGWDILGSGGEPLEGDPDSLYFTTVPDSAPLVRIVFPGVDTIFSPRMTQGLVVEASDDYGLARVELVSWRISAWGERGPDEVEPVALADSAPRASLTPIIDARGRGFLPGDTLRYYVRVYDNAPQPQVGRSREYALRLPTLDEVRERAVAEAKDLVSAGEHLAEKAREHQETTRALERSAQAQQTPGPERRTGRSESGVEFKDTEAARKALEEAGRLLEGAEMIEQSLRELQESIEQAGLNDTSVLERLRELESLYERIMTPELEALIEKLREALVDLDSQQLQEAIRELAEGSGDFRQRVEQSLELLRRAALEAELRTLETEAEELSGAHDEWAGAVEDAAGATADSLGARLEQQATELSAKAESLSDKLARFVEELAKAGEARALEQAQTAEQAAGEAARSDQTAARAMTSQRRQAREAARDAASQMRQAASALQQGREEMQQRWRQQVVEALQRAKSEALELAQRQDSLNRRMASPYPRESSEVRSEEVALKRGVDQLTSQLENAARETLLIDPALLRASGTIGATMQELLGQMGDGARNNRGDPRLGGQVSGALNELAYRLMLAADAAAVAQSGTGLQEALDQLAQLAEQQGQLNAQSGGINPADMSALIMQRLRELAQRQREVAQELDQLNRSLGPRGQVLGQLDALSREAEDLAREMERGRLNEQLVERQNRLFQRLLDAGRTLERDEYDKERRAERPEGVEVLRPGDLPEDVLRGTEFPLPGEEALRRYPPAFRRLILEYFDRLNQRGSSGGN